MTLFTFFRNFTEDHIKKLENYIPEINLAELPKIRKVNWTSIIEHPYEIFNLDMIEKKIAFFDDKIQIKIKK